MTKLTPTSRASIVSRVISLTASFLLEFCFKYLTCTIPGFFANLNESPGPNPSISALQESRGSRQRTRPTGQSQIGFPASNREGFHFETPPHCIVAEPQVDNLHPLDFPCFALLPRGPTVVDSVEQGSHQRSFLDDLSNLCTPSESTQTEFNWRLSLIGQRALSQ